MRIEPYKKYNIPKRTTIGRKCEDDPGMMYLNPNILTYFPDAELPEDQGRDARSSCLRIGTCELCKKESTGNQRPVEPEGAERQDIEEESTMARGKCRANTDTLDAKTEQQKAVLEKAKVKYEAENSFLSNIGNVSHNLENNNGKHPCPLTPGMVLW